MRKSPFLYWYLPAIIWASLLVVLTSLPKLEPPAMGLKMADKIYHFLFYAVLGFLWIRARVRGQSSRLKSELWVVGFSGTAFAALDELHQLFIPGRQCDLMDAVADTAGVLISLIIFKVLFNKYLKEKPL